MKILASVFQLWLVYKVNWHNSDREELNRNVERLLKKPNGWDLKELNFLLLRKKSNQGDSLVLHCATFSVHNINCDIQDGSRSSR